MSELAGKRILVTRASEQIQSVAECIRQRGGVPVDFPCLTVTCFVKPVREAVKLFENDGVQSLFTSSNGVDCVAHALDNAFASTFHSIPVIAIGRHTADTLRSMDIKVAWVPHKASQEDLMDMWQQRGLPKHLVFFRADQGRDMLPEAMRKAGVNVHLVSTYRTICPDDDASAVMQALHNETINAVLLGSSRTVEHYVQRVGDAHLANRPAIAVISEQVADTARSLNLDVQVVAKEASFASMLDGLEIWFQK